MSLTPKVARYLWYLLFAHHERRRSWSCDVDARDSSAEDVAAFERRLARLRTRCFLRTVFSDSLNSDVRCPVRQEPVGGSPVRFPNQVLSGQRFDDARRVAVGDSERAVSPGGERRT